MFVYNPHRVSRIERLAYAMVGDKVNTKVQRAANPGGAGAVLYWRRTHRDEADGG